MLLHDLPDFGDLIVVTARDLTIDPGLVEKDYWIMQALWGLQEFGFHFELKGGTSLSKGYQLIHRFSEDIDILIHPDEAVHLAHVTGAVQFARGPNALAMDNIDNETVARPLRAVGQAWLRTAETLPDHPPRD